MVYIRMESDYGNKKEKMGIVIRDLFIGWDTAQIMDSRQLEWAVSDHNIAICDDLSLKLSSCQFLGKFI